MITSKISYVLLILLIPTGIIINITILASNVVLLSTRPCNAKEYYSSEHIIHPAIGIHLGTTYSSVGAFKHPSLQDGGICEDFWNGRFKHKGLSHSDILQLIPTTTHQHQHEHDNGSAKAMPSCVAFTDEDDGNGVLIGQPAKDQESLNPSRTICGINRLLGRRFDDPEFQSYIRTLAYKVVNKENKPHIRVELKNGETKEFSAEDICAMILGRLKEMAETFLGVDDIKIATVLIHHSYSNREVLQGVSNACAMVGFKVLRVGASSPYVASLSDVYPRAKTLLYDLGGSAFAAVLMEGYDIILSKGDHHLGGQTFDSRLVDHFVSLIHTKYNNNITHDHLNNALIIKLRIECEKAKIALSTSDRATVKIEFEGSKMSWVFEETLTREKFMELNMDLFNRTIEMVKEVIKEGGMEKSEIEDVYLVGGSSEIPMVKQLVKNYFGKDPKYIDDVKPNEALAFAATLHAAIYSVQCVHPTVVHNEVAVGIETIGGAMMRLADSGPLFSESTTVTTYYDGQTTIEIKVFQGLRRLSKYCRYLGNLQIYNLPSAPRGVTIVEVRAEAEKENKIRIVAEHKATQNKVSMTIPYQDRRPTDRKMVNSFYEDYNRYGEQDKDLFDSISLVATLFNPQPRSMGFAPLDPFHAFRRMACLPTHTCATFSFH